MKINFRSFPHVVAIANRLGVKSLKVLNFVPEGRGLENVDRLALDSAEQQNFERSLSQAQTESKVPITYGGEVLPGTRCGVGSKLLITSDGYALPCLGLRDQVGLRVGNVKEQTLSKICDALNAIVEDKSCLCEKIHRSLAQ
jgi:MoaA/NifB/PqqE/SkfB family radical SAM enzyme